MATKEDVYDTQINPLMARIISICREHKIATLCSFSLDVDSGLQCTTALLEDEFDPPSQMLDALNAVYKKKPMWAAFTITNKETPNA